MANWVKLPNGKFAGSKGGSGGGSAKLDTLRARVKAASEALESNRAKTTARLKAGIATRRAREAEAKIKATGIRGVAVNQTGLRPASFAHLRAGGKVLGGPPTVTLFAGQKSPVITDGRHRITLARERGEKSMEAVVRQMGPRGGLKSKRMRIPI